MGRVVGNEVGRGGFNLEPYQIEEEGQQRELPVSLVGVFH